MNRQLKALGLGFVAALALCGLAASSASAQTQDLVTLSKATGILTGVTHNEVFAVGAGGAVKWECTTSSFSGTVANNATQVTIDATYTGKINETPTHGVPCNGTAGDATVDMNGCDYLLTGKTDASHKGVKNTHAQVHLVCPAGKEIVVTNGACQLSVPEQTPTEGGVTYDNEVSGGKWDVKATITITGIKYKAEGAFCGLAGLSTNGEDGTCSGSVTIKAFEDLAVGTPGTEGSQIDFTVTHP